ncbi:hypothetical protein NXV74_05635 [Bacteroides thetaiotaomicron]|nr:hypothetical protein [Bacteroides thetaiotaomicron]
MHGIFFGDEDPIGKQLTSSSGSVLTIRGIVGEPSTKASLQFDLIAPVNQGEIYRLESDGILHGPVGKRNRPEKV